MAANKSNHKRTTFTVGPVPHAEVTGDTTVPVFKARKRTRVDGVSYLNPTGLAEDAGNHFAGSLKNGSTVVATIFATDSDGAGADNSLAAGWTDGTVSSTPADRILEAGDELDLLLDETGAATLPAGSVLVFLTELTD